LIPFIPWPSSFFYPLQSYLVTIKP
jgi:hypothetical protein